ncbi:hypothetical protein ABW20_dc0103277 [Dactylellina cionopaga]|nr:hypothetical protein ABW20_dc0103277 [Dactylellina cionopaga]
MSFGVGVGDIIQLARIASRLSSSFSSGPTGAASEFHEIKTQLSSLSIILEALARESGKPGRNFEDARTKEKLGEMVDGCKAALNRLESIVDKYTDKLDSSWSWKIWFAKGYKLILWTTDGGDIRALKEDLHRHYVMIDAYINVLNRADLHQALNVLERMLAEKRHRRSLSQDSIRNGHNVLQPDAIQISSSSRPKTFEGFPPFYATLDVGYRRAAKVKMSVDGGAGTIVVKNESSDLMQREYTLYAPRIEEPQDEDFDERPYIISIPLRKSGNSADYDLNSQTNVLSKHLLSGFSPTKPPDVLPTESYQRVNGFVGRTIFQEFLRREVQNCSARGALGIEHHKTSQHVEEFW